MSALALVIEDGSEGEDFLQRTVEAEGFRVRAKRSPAAALDTLLHIDPLLAIVDWHVSACGPMSQALGVLAAGHPTTVVIVVSPALGDASVRWAISIAHPGALMHDRQAGPDALRLRIRGTVGRPFGDLVVRRGRAVHIPCGRSFSHPIGAQLVAGRGRMVSIPRRSAAAQAAWYFQAFLRLHGSDVTVAHDNSGFRRLVDTTALPDCATSSRV